MNEDRSGTTTTKPAASRGPLRPVSADERAPRPKPLESLGPAEWIGDTYHVGDRPAWMQTLRWTSREEKGSPTTFNLMGSFGNLSSIIANDPRWRGVLAYNEFADRVIATRPPPWHTDDATNSRAGELEDVDAARLSAWFDRAYHLKVSTDTCYTLALAEAHRNSFHPVREYLERLPKWDGVPRCDTWLEVTYGVPARPIYRAFASKFLIAAVARIFRPGCKVDTVLILEGDQGFRKSTGLEILAGGAEFFVELHGDLEHKDTLQMLSGKWIAEVSELASLRKSETESAKRFFSCRIDRYRPSFGRKMKDFPRQIVFAGTVNPNGSGYLTDGTGNRRYWPVVCTHLAARNELRAMRDQLWAEALHRFRSNERWWLTVEQEKEAREEQEHRLSIDEWENKIGEWLGIRTEVTIGEVLLSCLQIEQGKWGLAEQQRVGRVLARLRWSRVRKGSTWVYRKGALAEIVAEHRRAEAAANGE